MAFLLPSVVLWGKPRSSPKMPLHSKNKCRYAGYLAVQGPEPIFEEPPPVDFNRLMLTPIASGITAPETPSESPDNLAKPAQHEADRRAIEYNEDHIVRVESSAGGEYYAPHRPIEDLDSDEKEARIFPEDLLFFYEQGGKGASGNKNYYVPFNISPDSLIPQTPPARSKATYRRE